MTIISPQTSCSSISISTTDTVTLTGSVSASQYWSGGAGVGGSNGATITISSGGSSSGLGSTFFTGVNGGTISNVTAGGGINGAGGGYSWTLPIEFVDAFPDFDRIKAMCEQYPGLQIAYEKFVTTYKLVKDDYDNPKD